MLATVFLTCAATVLAFMLGLWLLSIPLRNVSIVDIGWGLGFILLSWIGMWSGMETEAAIHWPQWLLPMLVTIWGLRLAGYLAWRNIGKPEDHRYRAMRERSGRVFVWSSLGIVFGLQGAVMWVVALPIQTAAVLAQPETCLVLLSGGIALWAIGFGFESIGDWQLARFKSQPGNQGKVMNRGVWRYTRHPNYFGESLIWWGHWLVSLAVTNPRATWWTVISPALMTFLLIRVSGVALLEKSLKQRSAEYGTYIAQTNAFFPWQPKT